MPRRVLQEILFKCCCNGTVVSNILVTILGRGPAPGQVTLETVSRAGESPQGSPQAELREQGRFL